MNIVIARLTESRLFALGILRSPLENLVTCGSRGGTEGIPYINRRVCGTGWGSDDEDGFCAIGMLDPIVNQKTLILILSVTQYRKSNEGMAKQVRLDSLDGHLLTQFFLEM